jgi:hypothetical protein
MQFKLEITRPIPDLQRIEALLCDADPAALVGMDRAGATLRLASSLGKQELCELFGQAGYPVRRDELLDVPSECCGGCGG